MGKAKYWKGLTAAGIVLAVVLVVIVGISVFPEKNIKEYEETGEYSEKPSFDEVAAMILRHTKLQIEYKGEYLGIREMRKHVGWYTAGYKNSSSIRRKVNEVESYEQLEQLISSCIENN